VLATARRDATQELRQESLDIEAEAEVFSEAAATIRRGAGVQSGP
jgi:hypothetical protein